MNVTELQMFFRHIGMYYTHIISEKYSNETKMALLAFQRDNNLMPSGILDNDTKNEIERQVLKLKKGFIILGIDVNDTYFIDDETIMAIKTFQERHNLTVNGIMRKKDFSIFNKALNEMQNICINVCSNNKEYKYILESIKRFLMIDLKRNGINVDKDCNEKTVLIVELFSKDAISIFDNKGGELCNIVENELNEFMLGCSNREELNTLKININTIDIFDSAKKRDDLAKAISKALISILHTNQGISQV